MIAVNGISDISQVLIKLKKLYLTLRKQGSCLCCWRVMFFISMGIFTIFPSYAQNSPMPSEALQLQAVQQELIDEGLGLEFRESPQLCPSHALEQIRVTVRAKPLFFYPEEFVELRLSIENQALAESLNCTFQFLKFENPYQQIKLSVVDENQRQALNVLSYEAWLFNKKQEEDEGEGLLPPSALSASSNSDSDSNSNGQASVSKRVSLALGESFRFRFDVGAFKEIPSPGLYSLRGFFYPLGLDLEEYRIRFPEIVLELRQSQMSLLQGGSQNPRNTLAGTASVLGDERTSSYVSGACFGAGSRAEIESGPSQSRGFLQRPGGSGIYLSPAETAHEHLCAYQNKNLTRYLSFYNLGKILINSYTASDYFERFITASPYEQSVILQDFSEFLLSSTSYRINYFEILQSRSIAEQAEVDVFVSTEDYLQIQKAKFNPLTGQLEYAFEQQNEEPPLQQNRIFRYQMSLENGVWKITGFDVRIQGLDIESLRKRYRFQEEPSVPNVTRDVTLTEQVLANTILFDFNEAMLLPEAITDLRNLSRYLLANPQVSIRLIGYTDNLGSDSYNTNLSAIRVESVAEFLVNNFVSPSQMEKVAWREKSA